jgi:hypothetical protein
MCLHGLKGGSKISTRSAYHPNHMSGVAVWTASATGVPTALRFMPGLLDAVKSAVAREASQLFDKLAFVAGKVRGVLPRGTASTASLAGLSSGV